MSNFTEELVIEGQSYTLKTRLGWMERRRIEDRAFKVFVAGSQIDDVRGGARDFSDIESVEIRLQTADHDLARLCARLDMKPKDTLAIPALHAELLLARIAEIEKEEKAEIEALKPGNPTGM